MEARVERQASISIFFQPVLTITLDLWLGFLDDTARPNDIPSPTKVKK